MQALFNVKNTFDFIKIFKQENKSENAEKINKIIITDKYTPELHINHESEFIKSKNKQNRTSSLFIFWIITLLFCFFEILMLLFWHAFYGGPLFPGPISGSPKIRKPPMLIHHVTNIVYFFPLNILGLFSIIFKMDFPYKVYYNLSHFYGLCYLMAVPYYLYYDFFGEILNRIPLLFLLILIKYFCLKISSRIINK